MDIGLSVQQATGQVNVSPFAGLVNKRQFKYAGSCDETRLSVHRSKNHVRLSAKSLDSELLKLLLIHLPDLSNRLLEAAAFQPLFHATPSVLFSRPSAARRNEQPDCKQHRQ